ncbi:MAG: hypothetical protein DSO01_06650 [Archaeoglobi archaeon]|nr:MAG: hypothetical protein DSO01_06650 [Archaeoglobi archaeon]
MIQFFVEGEPAPAVRKNRSDRWRKRKSVEKEYEWRNWLTLRARQFRTQFFNLEFPVRVKIDFYFEGKTGKVDGDNLFKSVVDALVYDGLIPDDSIKYISEGVWKIFSNAPMTSGAMITIEETKND